MGPAVEPYPPNFAPIACASPLRLGTVGVDQGDIIFGDEDGVVVIPLALADTVMVHLNTVIEVEAELDEMIQRGAPAEAIGKAIARKRPS
jgi:regulator of RNase E activity RraA